MLDSVLFSTSTGATCLCSDVSLVCVFYLVSIPFQNDGRLSSHACEEGALQEKWRDPIYKVAMLIASALTSGSSRRSSAPSNHPIAAHGEA